MLTIDREPLLHLLYGHALRKLEVLGKGLNLNSRIGRLEENSQLHGAIYWATKIVRVTAALQGMQSRLGFELADRQRKML